MNGEIYIGGWDNDLKHGIAKLITSNGNEQWSKWENGKMI